MVKNLKAVKISDSSEQIALKYGRTVNLGIMEMERQIAKKSVITASQTFSSTPVPQTFDEEFWKRMKKTVETAIEPYVGRS